MSSCRPGFKLLFIGFFPRSQRGPRFGNSVYTPGVPASAATSQATAVLCGETARSKQVTALLPSPVLPVCF